MYTTMESPAINHIHGYGSKSCWGEPQYKTAEFFIHHFFWRLGCEKTDVFVNKERGTNQGYECFPVPKKKRSGGPVCRVRYTFFHVSMAPETEKKIVLIACGVVANVLDCEIVVCEFKLQSRDYVHFPANIIGKVL